MMTIKTEEYPVLFNELKAGDIFSFASAPDIVYIKTDKKYSIDCECEDCHEVNSIDMKNFCVELETGALYEASHFVDKVEKVILYKKAELILSR